MKKISLLLVVLLAAGSASLYGQMMIGTEFTVTGDATATVGYDIDDEQFGFKNEANSSIKLELVPESSVNNGDMVDMSGWHGYIELNDFKWVANDADGVAVTAPGVTAKLIMGAFSIQTFSSPDLEIDYVDAQDADLADGTDEDEFPGADFDDVGTTYGGVGLSVAYDFDPVMLSLGVVSENDWTEDKPDPENKDVVDCHTHGPNDDGDIVLMKCANEDENDQNDENAYAFIGTINLDIGDDADLEAKVSYAHEYSSGGIVTPASTEHDEIGIGAKANFNLGDITTHVAFDTAVPSGGAGIPWDVGGGVKWNLSADEASHVSTNMMMYSPVGGDSKLYVSLSLVEGEGDEGALEGMGAELTIGLDDAAGDSHWNANFAASYKVNDIKPYFDVGFGSAETATTSFKAGLELTMIKHLTATLEYSSTDVGGADKGDVTTALKISY